MTKRDPATIIAAAQTMDAAYGSLAPALYSSDTFEWQDADTKPEFDYSRTANPNRSLLVSVLAELEGAAGGVATNSGQSAALLALLILPADALVVAPHDCYGGTYRLIKGMEEQGRIRSIFVNFADAEAFEAALKQEPKLVWLETPSNPLLRLTDIAECSRKARAAGALTIADNTLLTPLRQRPLSLGCDLVMHSTTKSINGHADLFGGALLASTPELVEKLEWWSNCAGLNASAYGSWQTMRGLRTLPLRLDRKEATARRIADWLQDQEEIQTVHYPGLSTHADFDLAQRQQSGPGFMISFRIKGNTDKFLAALQLITLASSLGGYSTLICKPSTMTHRGMPPEVQEEAGIHPDLLRLSVGLEAAEDLLKDLEQGLAAAVANC